MSTRSNILITDGNENLLFYKHCDGYPTGQEKLLTFMKAIKEGKLRNNVSQCAGWLIILGHYDKMVFNQELKLKGYNNFDSWKVGDYEPTEFYSNDIEYFYICDIQNLKIIIYSANLWNSKLKNLKDEKSINKALQKGFLKEIGVITDFDNIKVLENIRT